MAGDRYVVLGLARARAEWFRAVGQWAASAALPAEFVKCVSAEELRARLASGRPFSAVLLDAGSPAVDRDLISTARDAGCEVLIVDDGRTSRQWAALDVAAVLPRELTREQLLDALATHCTMVGHGDRVAPDEAAEAASLRTAARVAVVCGPGGTGTSTVAMALSQGLAGSGASVVLADLCRRGDQAMLHDARDVIPGVQELVELHRVHRPSPDEVRALTFEIADRGYHLLLGLRRPRHWSTIRPRAFEAAFESLRRSFAGVVCDVTADFEGEDDAGSADVEERNHMARQAVGRADAVLVVGLPGLKGLYSLVQVMSDLAALGVPGERILPVVNRAPRGPRLRASVAAALSELSPATSHLPLFLPECGVEEAVRDTTPLPAPLPQLLAGALGAVLDRAAPAHPVPPNPERVVPGSLGRWAGREAFGA